MKTILNENHVEIVNSYIDNGSSQVKIAEFLGVTAHALQVFMRDYDIKSSNGRVRPISLFKIREYTPELKSNMLAKASNNPQAR